MRKSWLEATSGSATGYIFLVARGRRDWLGSSLGFIAFLGGIALLLLTFQLAYEMFHIPPSQSLNVVPGKTLQLAEVGAGLAGVLIRVVLLLVMGLVGSLVANRGVLLIGHCRPHHAKSDDHE